MPSREIDLETIEEWRELGFYYDVDRPQQRWILRGDRAGLLGFASRLRAYARNPKNALLSEHEHFGPYFYLTIITAEAAAISGDGWHGTLADFGRLAVMIEGNLQFSTQTEFRIGDEFAMGCGWTILFFVEQDGFDPSSADAGIVHRI